MAKKRGQNEGSIYQMKDGRWRAAVSIGWVTSDDGKPVWKRRVLTARTRAEVQEQLTAVLRDQQLGLNVRSEPQTLGEFLHFWLASVVKPSVRPKTFRSYEQMVRNHLVKAIPRQEWTANKLDNIPGIGNVKLSKLTVQVVQQFMNAKLQAGASASLVRYLRTVLRIALNEAVRTSVVIRNVAALCKPPRVVKSDDHGFAPQEAARLLAALKGHRLEALFTVALAVGLRHGEALALHEDDFDAREGTLRVHHTLQRVDGDLVRVETKSVAGKRVVPLPMTCVTVLLQWRERRDQYRALAGGRWQDTSFLFVSTVGTPLQERNVLRDFYKLLDAAKLPRRRIHDLRHACVSLLGAQGVDLKTIAELVGHSDIRLTQNVYQHAFMEAKRLAAQRMDDVLNSVATSVATASSIKRVN